MAWYKQLHWQILIGMALGTLRRVGRQNWGNSRRTGSPVRAIFLNLLKLIAMPLVITSLICGSSLVVQISKLSRMGRQNHGLSSPRPWR